MCFAMHVYDNMLIDCMFCYVWFMCSRIFAKITKKLDFVAMGTTVNSCMTAETISPGGSWRGSGESNIHWMA
jgi:hypothetical protein